MIDDVVVIGGGPAGSASAIRLAGVGARVRLYEKSRPPRSKLCGGFISPEAIPQLKDLGVWERVQRAGGRQVSRAVFRSATGSAAETRLPAPGCSIARAPLDAILLERARECGVNVCEATDGFLQPAHPGWTIVASGRSTGATTAVRHLRTNPFFGIQAFFSEVDGITDQVELDVMPGHYVGLVRQGDDTVNVCALVTLELLQKKGPSLDRVLQALQTMHAPLRNHLAGARRVSPWRTVGPVLIGRRRLMRGRTLYVGDAACVPHPFVGEGISMALHGAQILGDAFRNGGPIGEIYARNWEKTLGSLLRMQGLARVTLEVTPFQDTLLHGFRAMPSALGWLLSKTRLPIVPSPA